MPRSPVKPKPAPKRGKKTAKTSKTPVKSPELTPQAREFEAKLRVCSPQEQKFVLAKLDGRNNTDAAKDAGYSEKTARSQGSRLLTRVNITDAIKAGWSARGLGPDAVLAGIREMLEFDPGEVSSYVNEVMTDWVERPAQAVLDELRAEIGITRMFYDGLQAEKVPDEEARPIAARLRQMRQRELELVILLGKDEHARVLEKTERLKRVPYIDLEKVQEAGKAKYISAVKYTPNGRNIELVAHKDVLEMAGRAHGIFRETLALTGPDGGPLKTEATLRIEDMNGEQIAQHYAELNEKVKS